MAIPTTQTRNATSPKLPEWGRSYTVAAGRGESRSQLIRLQLPQPTDVTVYLQGLLQQTSLGQAQFATYYNITIGCGGIALVAEDMWVPAVGKALHFTTDRIEVTGVVTDSSGIAAAGSIRIAAAASPGSPNISYRTGFVAYGLAFGVPNFQPPANALTTPPTNLGWFRVAGNFTFVRVPAFATRARLMWDMNVGNTPDQILVYQVDGYGDNQPTVVPMQHPTAPVMTADQWSDFHLLDPCVSYIGFRSSLGGGGGADIGMLLVEFETYS